VQPNGCEIDEVKPWAARHLIKLIEEGFKEMNQSIILYWKDDSDS
jgi:hypothetical protein